MARIFRTVSSGEGHGMEEVERVAFESEKAMQSLVEKNIGVIFPDHVFVSSEFWVDDKRIDTVAFNTRTRSFAIIEYKNASPKGVLEQAGAYLTLLKQQRGDFLLAYNESATAHLKKADVAWNECRMIVIAPSLQVTNAT